MRWKDCKEIAFESSLKKGGLQLLVLLHRSIYHS